RKEKAHKERGNTSVKSGPPFANCAKGWATQIRVSHRRQIRSWHLSPLSPCCILPPEPGVWRHHDTIPDTPRRAAGNSRTCHVGARPADLPSVVNALSVGPQIKPRPVE